MRGCDVTEQTLARARAGDEDAFRELTDPYRRELQLHVYRIVGSAQDAEDLLQETLLAAWRGLERFEERASVRAWLYRIATNRSLDALRASRRRPEDLQRMTEMPEPTRRAEPIWLEPYPDVLLEGIPDEAPGPEARYETKEAIALAFIVGLQHLPPQQRAVLVLRDVLGFRAEEVAEMLDTTATSVNSLLRRARAAFESRLPAAGRERAPLPNSKLERDVVGSFADAVEAGDIDAMVALLTDDAWLTMPPEPGSTRAPPRSARSCATARSGAARRCGWCQRVRTASPRSGATSRSAQRTSRGRSRCSSSRSTATGYPRSPGSATPASSPTSDCRGRCGRKAGDALADEPRESLDARGVSNKPGPALLVARYSAPASSQRPAKRGKQRAAAPAFVRMRVPACRRAPPAPDEVQAPGPSAA